MPGGERPGATGTAGRGHTVVPGTKVTVGTWTNWQIPAARWMIRPSSASGWRRPATCSSVACCQAGTVRAAGAAVLARLRGGGWVCPDGTPSGQSRALNSAGGLSDPAFRAALTCAEFNQVPYLAPLRAAVRRILGAGAFSYPVKVLRAVYPERPGPRARGRGSQAT